MARDSELYKDKIEVSLDGRQIFYLFFGGAVIIGLVFVLGVMVGRRVEARGHVDRARTTAAVDPLAALDHLEGGAGLSFQDALRGEAPAASSVDKEIDDVAHSRQVAAAQARPAPHAVDGEPHARAEDHAAEIDARPAKQADKADKTDRADKSDKADGKKLADKKADGKKSDDGDQVDAKKSDKDHDGSHKRYTLQVSSFQDKSEADALVTTLKSSGYPASISTAEIDGKTFYRVRLGTYHSLDAANDARADFEHAIKKSASVMKL